MYANTCTLCLYDYIHVFLFSFFISDEINLKGHYFILFNYPCIAVSKIGQMLFDIIFKNLKKKIKNKNQTTEI